MKNLVKISLYAAIVIGFSGCATKGDFKKMEERMDSVETQMQRIDYRTYLMQRHQNNKNTTYSQGNSSDYDDYGEYRSK